MGESNINDCKPEFNEETGYYEYLGPDLAEIALLFTDDCSNVEISYTEKVLGDDCYWSVMYSYFASDDCGNANDTPIKIFYNGGDKDAPTFKDDADLSILDDQSGFQCKSEAPEAPKDEDVLALYEDDCGDVYIHAYDPVMTGNGDCNWSITYSWQVKDDCDNYADVVSVTYSGDDTTPPQLVGQLPPWYENGLDGCIDDAPLGPSDEEILDAYEDNCADDEDLTIHRVRKEAGTDCQWIVTWEITVEDQCGNISDMIKFNYQGNDNEEPKLEDDCGEQPMYLYTSDGADCPEVAGFDVQPGDYLDTENLFTVAGIDLGEIDGLFIPECFEDNCTAKEDLKYLVTFAGQVSGDSCGTYLELRFKAEDLCENLSLEEFTCQFFVVDNVAPEVSINNMPDGFECGDTIDLGQLKDTELDSNGLPGNLADKATYTDDCQDGGNIGQWSDSEVMNLTFVAPEYIIFSCIIDNQNVADLPFVTNGPDQNGYPAYDYIGANPFNRSLSYNVDEGRWEVYSSNELRWYQVTDGGASCNPQDWTLFDTGCQLIEISCDNEVEYSSGYKLTRTFSADDGCGNVGECSVMYTWTVCANKPAALDCPEGEDFGLVDVAPTNFAESVPYSDACDGEGETTNYTDELSSEVGQLPPSLIDGCVGPFSFQGFDSFGDGWNGTVINVLVNNVVVIADYTIADGFDGALVALPASPGDVITTEIVVDGSFDSEVSYNVTDGSDNVLATGGNPDTLDFALCTEPGEWALLHTLERTFTHTDSNGNDSSCTVTYTWATEAPGTTCDDAIAVECGGVYEGNTNAGQPNDLPFCDTGLSTAPGIWHVLAGTGEVLEVTADTNGSDFDTKLGVFTGVCGQLVCVGGNDDINFPDNPQSLVSFQSEIGVDYYIYVTGFSSNAGSYTLSVNCDLACLADAGTITADEDEAELVDGEAFISATPDGNANVPAGFETLYVLTSGAGLDIIGADVVPAFTVTAEGLYTIHTLVYDPLTLDPGTLPLDGSLSGGDVLDLIESQGLCASLDAAGAPVEVIDPANQPNIPGLSNSITCADGSVVYEYCYGNSDSSTWTFTSDSGAPLTLTFISGLIEEGFDIVSIYDGTDDSGTLLYESSGAFTFTSFDLTGATATSTGDSLHVVVSSDTSVSCASSGTYSAGWNFSVSCEALPPTTARVAAEEIEFKAFPVPFKDNVTISYMFEYDTDVRIEFYDARGLLVRSATNKNYVKGSDDSTYFDMTRFPSQMYYVKLTTNRGSLTKKIIAGK